MVQKCKAIPFSDWILLLSLLAIGSFYEYISCALCMIMGIWLLCQKKKTLRMPIDALSLSVATVCLAYGVVCLWAVDKGMAFVGFFKFLPLVLFLLCRAQEQKESVFSTYLPYVGAIMTVISAAGMLIPATRGYFSVADRLAGFFQYPNTFAVFLLVCQLLLLEKQKRSFWDYAVMAVLLGGILYTGSRTAFVIAALANLAMLLAAAKKKLSAVLITAGTALCVGVVIFLFRDNPVIGRYLRFSLSESTFTGRLLYVTDAIPLLFKYPFGMGYMGYSFVQQSVQTGLYSVTYVHNDLMQLLLDIGWLPVLFFAGALLRWFFKKDVPAKRKVIAGSLLAHCLMDFDLQYIGIFLLLLALTETACPEKSIKLRAVGMVPVTLACLYMGTALTLSAFGLHSAAVAVYNANTVSNLRLLEQAEDVDTATVIAQRILRTNTHYYAPYSVKAKYAYSQGDFASLIQYKNKVFEANPFAYEEYEEYCQMLINGIMLYEKAGDEESAAVCRRELIAAAEKLRGNEERLSALGKQIEDQPVTELPAELQEYINRLQ